MKTPKRTTLCFVINTQRNELLMIEKKRGQGKGYINCPGGKIAEGETALAAAIRECFEETGIAAQNLEHCGTLEFYFDPASGSWDNICEVYRSFHFTPAPLIENDECRPFWQSLEALPFDQMWEDDCRWVPTLLAGQKFHRRYYFNRDNKIVREGKII